LQRRLALSGGFEKKKKKKKKKKNKRPTSKTKETDTARQRAPHQTIRVAWRTTAPSTTTTADAEWILEGAEWQAHFCCGSVDRQRAKQKERETVDRVAVIRA